jgi:hypothetical protein
VHVLSLNFMRLTRCHPGEHASRVAAGGLSCRRSCHSLHVCKCTPQFSRALACVSPAFSHSRRARHIARKGVPQPPRRLHSPQTRLRFLCLPAWFVSRSEWSLVLLSFMTFVCLPGLRSLSQLVRRPLCCAKLCDTLSSARPCLSRPTPACLGAAASNERPSAVGHQRLRQFLCNVELQQGDCDALCSAEDLFHKIQTNLLELLSQQQHLS